MDEQIEDVADGPAPEPKRNRGWFKAGDCRINLEGRPVGKKVTAPDSEQAGCARAADRVKRLFIEQKYLSHQLTSSRSPWIISLPSDSQIVDCRFDPARNGVVLIVRSATFPRIAKGAVIPEKVPHCHGLQWRESRWPTWQ